MPVPESRVHIVIPFYRNPELVSPLLNSLLQCAEELKELGAVISIVNDSPDDVALEAEIDTVLGAFPVELPYVVTTNMCNLGFIRSVNSAFASAVAANADVVVLNSDTVVLPGALREMRRVAYLDPMIGFVSPRSNNATLCTFPQQREYLHLSPTLFNHVFQRAARYLPAFHYVPTCVGFCLYIKKTILAEIGYFDEIYGKGYNEENDLIMRANRFGFRAALANRALVYHIGEKSFNASDVPKAVHERKNSELLLERYPEYMEQVNRYFKGTHHEAERLLAGLIPDRDGRLDLAFDCTHVSKNHNGTFRALARVIRAASVGWVNKFNLYVIADKDVADFHGLSLLPGVLVCPVDTKRVFAVVYRLGQPFEDESFLRLCRLAPINVYAMVDTIAWDCLYLNQANLDELWRGTARYADGILFISDFNRDQFRLRFPLRPGMAEQVSYLSLVPQDYADGVSELLPKTHQPGTYLLLIGNSYTHKYIVPTVNAVARHLPQMKMVALGLQTENTQNLTAYGSGQLDSNELAGLFAGARAVIFPSTYEGFGMPVLEAMSFRRVLYLRDTPLNRALWTRLGMTKNMILYDSTSNLIQMLESHGVPEWTDDVVPTGAVHDWEAHAQDTRELIERAINNFSFDETLIPRLSFARLLKRANLREGQHGPHEETFAERRQFLQECGLDATIAPSEVIPLLEELRDEITGLKEKQSSKVETEIANLQLTVRERERSIVALKQSLSWAITAPLRFVLDVGLRLIGRSSQ